jgi:hypothetical protein
MKIALGKAHDSDEMIPQENCGTALGVFAPDMEHWCWIYGVVEFLQ